MSHPSIELGDLGSFRNGANFKKDQMGVGDQTVINVKNLYSDTLRLRLSELDQVDLGETFRPSRDAVRKGDLFFVRSSVKRDGVGVVCVAQEDGPSATHCGFVIRFRPEDDRVDPAYLGYLFRSPEWRGAVINASGGATITNLSQTALSRLEIPCPPLEIQQRIAAILGAYDDLIEVNRKRIAILEEMARRLFEDAVVKRTGCLPPPTGGEGDVDLPDAWNVADLSAIAKITMGQSPRSNELNKDHQGIPFHQGVSDFGSMFPARRVYCEQPNPKKVAQAGDILFSVRAPVGRINLATEPILLGRGMSAIRADGCNRAFLVAHLLATFHETDLMGNGAIYKAVGRKDIDHIPIVLPRPDEQETIGSRLKPLYELMWNLEQAKQQLVASRDLLLPRLISGQLSVGAAESELEDAA